MTAPHKYLLELRERAVRMYRSIEPKPQIKRLALELGVHPETLRGWIRQAEADAGECDTGLWVAPGAPPASGANPTRSTLIPSPGSPCGSPTCPGHPRTVRPATPG
ncbi:transposase [Streptomyces sp. NBC_00057]|uniref:transposase n=1 Tax=Streptomyces sp. NBC_00057 TaxID=2975634 RepID=UPI00325187C5